MFAVFSVLGGAAAFEVRRRTAVTNERRQLRRLREDRNGLDALLQELKGELSTVLNESAGNRAAFEAIQRAATELEQRCSALKSANDELTAQQAGLIKENVDLRATNVQLTSRLAAVEAEQDAKRAELTDDLEALKEEVKVAVEEYVDGMLSTENLRARLENMGVEVKFVEGNQSSNSEEAAAVDDTWLLKLRSAFEPEQAAKLLSMGAGMEAQSIKPVSSTPALAARQHVDKTERALTEQQSRMLSERRPATESAAALNMLQRPTHGLLVYGKENASQGTASSATRKQPSARHVAGKSGDGLSFELGNESKPQQKLQPNMNPRRGNLQKPLAPVASGPSALPLQDSTNVRGLEFPSATDLDMAGNFTSRSTDVILR